MEQNVKICAVVVTFNRKELLKNCLNAIQKQTYKPHTVIIVDNASTDGTQSLVEESGYYNQLVDGIKFQYLLLPNNQGGAGGFYHGMKTAYDSPENFDAVWVMDDDGVADRRQLEELVSHLTSFDFISPLVKAKEDDKMMAFYDSTVRDYRLRAENNIVKNEANPFNGILFSRKLISQVGFPKKELFIWGDETNYWIRCKKNGFFPITVVNAIHVHPKDRQTLGTTFFDKTIRVTDVDWKLYCLLRNQAYNGLYGNLLKNIKCCIANYLKYSYYYRKIHQPKDLLIISALFDGLFQRWGHLGRWFKRVRGTGS